MPAPQKNDPIFIYSGFRTSSTWLWTKFRAQDNLLCYYEPFNEQLESLTLGNIEHSRPDSWRSHHPNSAPYVLEYAGLLGDGTGVAGFPARRHVGDGYIGKGGPEGPLDQDVESYVRQLIRHAYDRERVPLLACTRMLGRAHGLRTAFGGYHILLVRNLFQQWNSYAGQAKFGNWYFLQTLHETLELASQDPTIARLAQTFSDETRSSLRAWVEPGNFDKIFCYFVGFHLYFLTIARRSADLVIDVNTLAGSDPNYRHEIVATIVRDIGVNLNLDDVTERVDFPIYPIVDRQTCAVRIEEVAGAIKSSCHANPQEQIFIDSLVANLWREEAVFRRQTAGAAEYLDHLESKLQDSQREADQQMLASSLEREASALAFDAERQNLQNDAQERQIEQDLLQVRIAEQEMALRAAEADLADALKAGTLRSDSDALIIRETLEKLAVANNDLADTHNATREARQALEALRAELEIERLAHTQRESEIAVALMEVARLRTALTNVDAENVNLAERLQQAQRAGDTLKKHLAGALAETSELHEQLARIFMNPDAQNALRKMLDLLITHRLTWALLPKPLWCRALRESLGTTPGFAHTPKAVENDATTESLAAAIWTALLDRR